MSKRWKFTREIIGILKKWKDADPADSHQASLDRAKSRDRGRDGDGEPRGVVGVGGGSNC